MKPSRKLYKVKIGLIENDVEFNHWESKNVIAGTAEEAMRKSKSRKKGTYISAIEMLHEIDKI